MVCTAPSNKNNKKGASENNVAMNIDNEDEVAFDETFNDAYKLTRIAGGSLIDHRPIFSPNGKYLFIMRRNTIHVYSTTTGEWVRDFENSGVSGDFIAIEISLTDSKYLFACTKLAEIVQWNLKTGSFVTKQKLPLTNFTLETFTLLDIWSNSPCALITFRVSDTDNVQLAVIDIINGKRLNCPLEIKLKESKVLTVADTKYFHYFAIAQNNILHVVNYKNWHYKKFKNPYQVPITALQTHPLEELVATGDATGKIFLYRNLWKDTKESFSILYHWHHTCVTSIAFTDSGTGFYSGGQEAVLVKWNIQRPNLKDFVPRISSIISHIVVGDQNKKIAVCTADNGIQIFDDQSKPKCVLQNFTYVYDNKCELDKFPVGLLVNPSSNCLVLNGRTGNLQFFSTYTKSLLYNMDIVAQNRLSMESSKILYDIMVTKAAFNSDWMATGEVWDDQEHVPELRLKFWEYQKQNQTYNLNTNIELPHEGGFKAIKFSSPVQTENLLCATLGCDNFIKIWSLDDSDNIYKKEKVWFCIAQTRYKNLSATTIDFSEDGSLLSTGYGNNLCIYKSDTLKLHTVLTAPATYDSSLQKIQICFNKEKLKHGRHSESSDKHKKILDLFKKFLQKSTDKGIVEIIKKSSPKLKVKNSSTKIIAVNNNYREILFKKIQKNSELNLFQKFLLYQKLKIFCNVSHGAQTKILQYLNKNCNNKNYSEHQLRMHSNALSGRNRFKAKYKLKKYSARKNLYQSKVDDKLIPLVQIFNFEENEKIKKENSYCNDVEKTNGVESKIREENSLQRVKGTSSQLQNVAEIRQVIFCKGEFNHLIIISTEHRVLIWNLLTLRLQCLLQLSIKHIAVDDLTSLCAAFTTQNELYIFLPHAPISLYHRVELPEIVSACWIPRRCPKSQSISLDWQSMSTLYFLTEKQELMFLSSENDSDDMESSTAFIHEPQDITRYSVFGAHIANKMNPSTSSISNFMNTKIGVPGKAEVKSIIYMASHTMAPVNLLCNKFIRSLLINDEDKTTDSPTTSKEVKGADESEDSEDDSTGIYSKIQLRKKIAAKAMEAVNNLDDLDNTKDEKRLRDVLNETIDIQF